MPAGAGPGQEQGRGRKPEAAAAPARRHGGRERYIRGSPACWSSGLSLLPLWAKPGAAPSAGGRERRPQPGHPSRLCGGKALARSLRVEGRFGDLRPVFARPWAFRLLRASPGPVPSWETQEHHLRGSSIPRSAPRPRPLRVWIWLPGFPRPDTSTLTPLPFPAAPQFPISSRGAVVSSAPRTGALNPLVPNYF